MPPKARPIADRFWPKVEATGFCWLWTGSRDQHGYGRIKSESEHIAQAHRVAYALLVGPVPEGLVLDHLCRNPSCVNPDHLEPVTNAENLRRGFGWSGRKARQTHCLNGHELTGDNVYRPRGRPSSRWCLQCRRDRDASRVRRVIPPGEEFEGACAYGHDFTPENTWVSPERTARRCRTCNRRREASRVYLPKAVSA